MKPSVHIIKFTKTSGNDVKETLEDSKELECLVCDQCFTSQRDLSEHLQDVHGYLNDYQELKDGNTFKSESSGRHTPNVFCSICQETFVKVRSLVDHLLENHIELDNPKELEESEIKSEPMEIVIESVRSEAAMDEATELMEKVDKNNAKCWICHESFDKRNLLNNHLLVKHLNKKFECHICEENRFENFQLLAAHMRYKHQNSPVFKCHLCIDNKKFARSQSLLNHHLKFHLTFTLII